MRDGSGMFSVKRGSVLPFQLEPERIFTLTLFKFTASPETL